MDIVFQLQEIWRLSDDISVADVFIQPEPILGKWQVLARQRIVLRVQVLGSRLDESRWLTRVVRHGQITRMRFCLKPEVWVRGATCSTGFER